MFPYKGSLLQSSLLWLIFTTSSQLSALPEHAPQQGQIINDKGESCAFTHYLKDSSSYFYDTLENVNGVLTFASADCMADSGEGMKINMHLVNKAVSKWYSHDGAVYELQPSDTYGKGKYQKQGMCIPSSSHPDQGFTIDYIIFGKGIEYVMHGSAFEGCMIE